MTNNSRGLNPTFPIRSISIRRHPSDDAVVHRLSQSHISYQVYFNAIEKSIEDMQHTVGE
mgnify:CR=1 FL=1